MIGVAASLGLLTAGCMSSLQKHSAALSAATAPVVDQASAAYHSANAIHDVALQYDAYSRFGKSPVYKPKEIQPLLSPTDIDVRLAILAAFQLYVKNIVEITGGTDSPQLQAASKSVGSSLTNLANTVGPTVEGGLGITPPVASTTQTIVTTGSSVTSTTSTTAAPIVSTAVGNGISTAVDALGQFLASRKIRKELPGIVVKMDLQLRPLWTVLEKDIALLEDQETRDYDTMIDGQTGFVLANPTLDAQERREQIMKLPGIVEQQRDSSAQLTTLSQSIHRLAMVHHAFAADAQGNNPESLKSKLAQLAAAGSDLGKFYSSLPTQ